MANARMASRIADRGSASVRPMLNPAKGPFQASRAADMMTVGTGPDWCFASPNDTTDRGPDDELN